MVLYLSVCFSVFVIFFAYFFMSIIASAFKCFNLFGSGFIVDFFCFGKLIWLFSLLALSLTLFLYFFLKIECLFAFTSVLFLLETISKYFCCLTMYSVRFCFVE